LELVHEFFRQQVSDEADPLRPCVLWTDHGNWGHSEVIVVSWNRDRLLTKIVGAFSLAELNILSANIFTRGDDVVIDTFRVCTQRGEEVSDQRDKRAFEKVLYESLAGADFDFSEALDEARKKAKATPSGEDAFPTMLRFDNEASPHFTLLYLQAPDRIGLLHTVSSCLNDLGIGIEYARISTEKGAALDTFYIHDLDGEKITGEAQQKKILQTLRQSLSPKRT
jgi:[protein-PII] uridylyltransferase